MKALLTICSLLLVVGLLDGASINSNYADDILDNNRFNYLDRWAMHTRLEKYSEYHLNMGKSFVQNQLHKQHNKGIAKNIIFFLGDGMSVTTVDAARMLLGGEDQSLSFEKFPFLGMSKTYCVDQQVADSACSATAYLCGVKTNYGTIGVNAKVKRSACMAANDKSTHTSSIAKWALDAGKSVGLVTTTRVTHASPAGLYAHTAERNWESNRDIQKSKCDENLITDIAEQLVHDEVSKKFKVIFGGGREKFLDSSIVDDEGILGDRTDGKNLIEEWQKAGGASENRKYVWNKASMNNLDPNNTDAVLGLFATSHCPYNYEVDGISDTVPTLTEMTTKAIELLSTNENGFFLFVEGGRIDQAHHKTQAHIALSETVEFAKAVSMAQNEVNGNDTLILVTADHAHTMSYSGYAERGKNIFGVANRSDVDNLPFLKLSYANGPGFSLHRRTNSTRPDPTKLKVNADEFEFPATVPKDSETHGGDDVAVYAIGPHAHLFRGTFEQHTIPHVLAYASCIGNGLTACNRNKFT